MGWQKWHWRVVRDEFDYAEKEKFIDEGYVKSPSLKNARQRALQASAASQDWWQGEWREKTFGKIMQPQSKVTLHVYTDYEYGKDNILILEKIETVMEVKLFDTYISRIEPSQFQHRKRPYDVSRHPCDWHFLVGITPNFLTGTPIEDWAQETADNLQRHVAIRYHYKKVSESDDGMLTEIFTPEPSEQETKNVNSR